MTTKIIATVSTIELSDPESWVQRKISRRISREFAVNRSINDILKWAENEGISNPKISDIVLSDYTGSSI